jgi:hypothetical protein
MYVSDKCVINYDDIDMDLLCQNFMHLVDTDIVIVPIVLNIPDNMSEIILLKKIACDAIYDIENVDTMVSSYNNVALDPTFFTQNKPFNVTSLGIFEKVIMTRKYNNAPIKYKAIIYTRDLRAHKIMSDVISNVVYNGGVIDSFHKKHICV